MSLERGTRPGGPRTDGPADGGTRIAVAAMLAGVALLVSILLAIGALTPAQAPVSSRSPAGPSAETIGPSPVVPDTPLPATSDPSAQASASPTPSLTPEPTPAPTPSLTPEPTPAPTPTRTPRPTPTRTPRPTPTRTPAATANADDPSDLPRYPGSRLVRRAVGRGDDLATLTLEYTTPARLDRVRRHYRSMLRHHGWFVGDVEFDDDGWEIEANKGKREASIELRRHGDRTEVGIEVSWPSSDRSDDDDDSGPDD